MRTRIFPHMVDGPLASDEQAVAVRDIAQDIVSHLIKVTETPGDGVAVLILALWCIVHYAEDRDKDHLLQKTRSLFDEFEAHARHGTTHRGKK